MRSDTNFADVTLACEEDQHIKAHNIILTACSPFSRNVLKKSKHSHPKMEGDPQMVCKFHQYGHCKFGPHCWHFNTKDTCSTPTCKQNSCTARHPKPCLYFPRNSYYKFGSSRSFLHPNLAPASCQLQNDVKKLNDDLHLVITSLNIKK